MSPVRVRIACDYEIMRNSLAALLDSHDHLEIVRAGAESLRRLEAVRRTNPDVVVLAVPPDEDTERHTEQYLDSSRDAGVVGFCMSREQAEGDRRCGIDEIVDSRNAAAELSRAIHRAAELRRQ